MRKLLLSSAAVLSLWGCSGGDGGTGSTVATTVSITPNPVTTLDAIGATQKVKASVLDQKGRAMPNAAIVWASSSAAVTVSSLGGDSAMVTAAAAGTASITATVGTAVGTASATVNQVPTAIEKVGGDNQQAAAGTALPAPIIVRVKDRLGAGVANKTVTFAISSGAGTLSTQTVTTAADGTAAVTWTLGGATGQQTVTATTTTPALSVIFTAIAATTGGANGLSVVAGGEEAVMVGTATSAAPSVKLLQNGAPAAGVQINFTTTTGGTVANTTAVTDANGVASAGTWTVTAAGPTFVTATVAAGGVTPVVFSAYGCEGGGGSGYAITLCFTTPMTVNQRAAFQNAAARWATVITGDLTNVTEDFAANDCESGTPAVKFTIDDLVIFAAVSDIDGVGAVLGQAGACFIRDAGGPSANLSVMGSMEFDVADVVNLEGNGGLGSVITHEMGHVLGISGGIWNIFGLLQDPSTGNVPKDTWFSGTNGIAGFDAIGGTAYTTGKKVPVENTGGAGTANSHWRESVLKNELMTGYLNAGSNPLSLLTVRSLQDLGYTVDLSAADVFSINGSGIQANRTGTGVRIDMGDDQRHGPVYRLGKNGRRTRVQ